MSAHYYVDDGDFNSRPHGGRPGTPIDYPIALGISTHALTEGD